MYNGTTLILIVFSFFVVKMMSKLNLKSVFAACLMLCIGVSALAATYCGTAITSENNKHSAAITCSSLGENRYLFEFVSEDEFTGYNADGSNFYMNVDGKGGYHVSEHLTKDGNRLYVEFTSTSVPNIYVGDFYVQYSDGEAHYKVPTDGDFSKMCSGKQASDLTLTEPATTIWDLQIGDDFTIKYTTSSTGAVTFSSSNTDVATVSADGVIKALAGGTATITVSQAEDDTYNAGRKSFTLSVIDFATTNLALNKPAVAGWGETPTFANNGNYGDRWGSNGGPKDYSKDWWYVDLGNYYDLDRVEIYWENAYSTNFVIQGAKTLPTNVEDDDLWLTLYAFEGEPKHTNNGATAQTDAKNEYIVSGAARYVRIRSYKNSLDNAYGMSMWEFRVFGTGVIEPDDIVPDMVSAKVLSVDQLNRTVTLELKATRIDLEGTTSEIHNFRLINTVTGKQRMVTTDANGQVVLDRLNPCETYKIDVVAVGYLESDNPMHVEFETPAGNMAYKRTATAGFSESSCTPDLAVDGVVSANSRWSSWNNTDEGPVGNAWWMVDLAEIRSIDSIRVNYHRDWVDCYEIATSLDQNSWSPLVISNTPPELDWNVYKVSAIGRYIRMAPLAKSKRHNWSIREFEVYGDCTYDDKPRMIFASLESVATTTAEVRVSATDAVTPFAELEYECILTQGENVYRFTIPATDGILHLENMRACAGHTLEVWAINKAGKKSDNSAMVRFTTECETTGLWLAGSMNGWNEANADYQFHKTSVDGVYSLTKHFTKGSYVYKLTEGSWDVGKCTKDDHHLVLSEDMDVTFYARGVNNFASSVDSIFLIGTATSDFLPESGDYKPAWDCKANGKYCEWNAEHTSAIWTGNVYGVSGDTKGEYKIVKIAYLNGTEANMPFVYWNDLYEANQTISGVSESSTKASFVFDLPTLTWSWQEVYEGQCTFNGGAGDGQTSNGSETFTKGYTLSLYLNAEKTLIHITAEFLDEDKNPTDAYFQNYPTRIEAEKRDEFKLTLRTGTKIFEGDIPVSGFENKADGIIRFGVKFAFAGGLRVTTPEFYYLDGSGCAERDFVIYHHGQTPADAERDAVESFAGGRILQPIQYKRKLRPNVWETLSIPFEVNKVTVTDEDGEYEIYPQYDNDGTVTEGEFWLRDFRKPEVSAEDFQANWHDIQATTAEAALPKKNVPYIIRVPDDDTHYWADKYIVFHGESYQTIDDVYSTDVQTPRAIEMFAYSGNNTMKEWLLRSAYVLDDKGEYFRSGETVTLYPFECAVNAEQATIAKMPRLSLNKRPGTATDSKIPTTAMQAGSVWTLMGAYVGAFGNVDEYDALLQRLPEGVYIVSRGEQADKLYLVK